MNFNTVKYCLKSKYTEINEKRFVYHNKIYKKPIVIFFFFFVVVVDVTFLWTLQIVHPHDVTVNIRLT